MMHPFDDETSSPAATSIHGGSPPHLEPDLIHRHEDVLLALTAEPDHVIERLCSGEPRHFLDECRQYVVDNAYFLDAVDLAAQVIARVAFLAGRARGDAALAIDTIVEVTAADAILTPQCVETLLAERLSQRLGVRRAVMPGLCVALNAYALDERHPLYRCLVEGLTAEQYSEQFGSDRATVIGMLGLIQQYAVQLDAAQDHSPPSGA